MQGKFTNITNDSSLPYFQAQAERKRKIKFEITDISTDISQIMMKFY